MDRNVLSHFYQFNGRTNQFCKTQFIRLIRNKIIDPNTQHILQHGFQYYIQKDQCSVRIPCDDCNWCQYLTFYQGLKNDILSLPLSIKLYHDYFLNIQSMKQFQQIFFKIIQFRTNVIKQGWAVKYGLTYKENQYQLLDDLNQQQLISWKDPRKNIKMCLDMLVEQDFDIR